MKSIQRMRLKNRMNKTRQTFFGVILAAVMLMIFGYASSSATAYAQKASLLTNVTNAINSKDNATKTAMLNVMTYQSGNYDRLTNIAKLHNATTAQLDSLTNQKNIFSCLSYLFDVSFGWTNSKSLCDSTLTDEIIHHDLGSNQTLIDLAHIYLKARGIQ